MDCVFTRAQFCVKGFLRKGVFSLCGDWWERAILGLRGVRFRLCSGSEGMTAELTPVRVTREGSAP